jgi:DNA-binding transcriptional ArsR family regulator
VKSTVLVVDDPEVIAVAVHPLRAKILVELREETTAAEVARKLGQSRQNIAYHVQTLLKAGLIRHVSERRKGSFVEQIYQAVAPSIVISARSGWDHDPKVVEALADQVSLRQLVDLGDQMVSEAAGLLDRAAFDGESIASASAQTTIRFADEDRREAFLRGYVEAVADLAKRHGSPAGQHYRIVHAIYPLEENQ